MSSAREWMPVKSSLSTISIEDRSNVHVAADRDSKFCIQINFCIGE
jgi:hypothetical protein